MAVLDSSDRAEVAAEFQRLNTEPLAVTKDVIPDVVAALDDAVEGFIPSCWAVVDSAGGESLTSSQRTNLANLVVKKRFERL